MYDVTNRESFTNALAWKRKLDLSETVKPEVVTVLVGNKADVDGGREVPTAEGLRIAGLGHKAICFKKIPIYLP